MIKKIFKKLKNEKGITGQDLIIAIFILMMFLVLIFSVYANIKSLSYEIRMNARAADTASKIAEKLYTLEYDDPLFCTTESTYSKTLTTEELRNDYGVTGLNSKIYQVNFKINKLKFDTDETNYDLTKEIIIQVKYDLKGDFENADATEIKLVRDRDVARIEDEIEILNGYKPVVITNGGTDEDDILVNTLDNLTKNSTTGNTFLTTSESNPNWKNYSYFDKFLCCIGASTSTDTGEALSQVSVLVWVPRYAIVDGKLAFLYKETNYPVVPIYSVNDAGIKIITGYKVDRTTTLTASSKFSDGERGKWAALISGNSNYDAYSEMITYLNMTDGIYTGN